MVHTMDEADLLFGDGTRDLPEDEATLLFAMQSKGLSLDEKLRMQDLFRTASPAEKLKILDRFCGAVRPEMRPFLPPSLGGTQP